MMRFTVTEECFCEASIRSIADAVCSTESEVINALSRAEDLIYSRLSERNTLQIKHGRFKFGRVAGVVSIGDLFELEIIPKFMSETSSWRSDFLLLMGRTGFGDTIGHEYVQAGKSQYEGIPEILGMMFLKLYDSVSHVPIRTYKRIGLEGFAIEGDVDEESLILPGPNGFIQSETRYSRNNEHNAIICAAAATLLRSQKSSNLANRLERAIWQLGGVQKLPNARPKSVPRRYASWGFLYALSLRILDGYGVSYSVPDRDMECPSFIVKSAKAWEELLRASLVLGYRGSRVFYQKESYFASRDAGAIYVKPDYYIELKEGTIFLADAKYKFVNSISNADAYEGFAFLEATKTTKLVLIYPSLETDSRGFEVFQHIARNDKDIFGVKVNPRQLIGTSVHGFCTAFAEYISSLSRA